MEREQFDRIAARLDKVTATDPGSTVQDGQLALSAPGVLTDRQRVYVLAHTLKVMAEDQWLADQAIADLRDRADRHRAWIARTERVARRTLVIQAATAFLVVAGLVVCIGYLLGVVVLTAG